MIRRTYVCVCYLSLKIMMMMMMMTMMMMNEKEKEGGDHELGEFTLSRKETGISIFFNSRYEERETLSQIDRYIIYIIVVSLLLLQENIMYYSST
jgi:hypothetical protein